MSSYRYNVKYTTEDGGKVAKVYCSSPEEAVALVREVENDPTLAVQVEAEAEVSEHEKGQ